MILTLHSSTTLHEVNALAKRLTGMGLTPLVQHQDGVFQIALIKGIDDKVNLSAFAQLPHVKAVVPMHENYKLSAREVKSDRTVIQVGDCAIGGGDCVVMAGPCAIEDEAQIFQIAKAVAQAGARFLRGGAFKPRTSPYSFQGLGEQGLQLMQAAAKEYGLLSVSEVVAEKDVNLVASYIDMLQIGARNMQNFPLLQAVGKTDRPVLLKRGPSATYQELLLAAEYIMSQGNEKVILCERGIRTFEPYSRNTLDLAAVPILHELSHLPVIVDPSHGTGLRHCIAPMSLAAKACGADGLIIEVHHTPDASVTDAKQAISCEAFEDLMGRLALLD